MSASGKNGRARNARARRTRGRQANQGARLISNRIEIAGGMGLIINIGRDANVSIQIVNERGGENGGK